MAATIKEMDFNDEKSMENYLERFELYCMTHKTVTEKNKTAFFLTFIGDKAYGLLKDLFFPKDIREQNPKVLHEALLSHLRPANFALVERSKFHKLKRDSNESIKDFSLRVHQASAKCDFKDQLEEQIRDRLVAGINNEELERKLLEDGNLTYQRAKDIIFNFDKVTNAVSSSFQVMKIQEPQRYRKSQYTPRQYKPERPHHERRQQGIPGGQCFSCGGMHYRKQCQYRNAKCYNCNMDGHLAKVCKKPNSRQHATSSTGKVARFAQVEETSSAESQEEYSCLHLSSDGKHIKEAITFYNGERKEFILDTGSPVSLMPYSYFKEKFPDATTSQYKGIVAGVTGHQVNVKGKVCLYCSKPKVNMEFLLISQQHYILGLDNLSKLNFNYNISMACSSTTLPKEVQAKVAHCGALTGGMNINPVEIDCPADPVFFKARTIAYGLREPVQANLNDLVQRGIISPVTSSQWASPIVTPLKANGQPRVCGDYRVTINSKLEQRSCTLPEPEDIFAKLNGANYFSRVDLKDAFLQIPIANGSKKYTTINTPFGLFQYNFLPFGLTISPSVFQTTIDYIIQGLKQTIAYQDDIIVFSETAEEQVQLINCLLDRLIKFNVKINTVKSTFLETTLPYLGYLVTKDGVKPDPKKYQSIMEAPNPKNVAELRSFLGCIQYYSRFIKSFANLAEPLYQLLTDEEFKWTEKHDKAKRALVEAVVYSGTLSNFTFTKPIDIITDASNYAIGAVLEQSGKPVMFISRRLNSSERGYGQTQKEGLAIIWAVKRFHKYIFGRKFNIISDHEALKFIYNPERSLHRNTAAMVQRWAITLSAYNYTIEFRKGVKIPQADFLSRHAHMETAKEDSLFLHPLPISRNDLISATRDELGGLIHALRKGWSTSSKRRFSHYFKYKEHLSITPDNVILYRDQVCIPSTLRKSILDNLHLSHSGRDRMISLARQSYWWPQMEQDITNFVRQCLRCGLKPKTHPTFSSWPNSYEPLQRIHMDYCGPILGFYGLVIIDTFSRYPEIFLTKKADANFTKMALRRYMSRFGVPQTIVSDNGTHFNAELVKDYLKSLNIIQLFSPPRHPRSNGIAENFIKSYKNAIYASEVRNENELNATTDNFLLQYRSTPHGVTSKSPAELFLGRVLKASLLRQQAVVVYRKGTNQIISKGVVVKTLGRNIFVILDMNDQTVHRRHRDQIVFNQNYTSSFSTPSENPCDNVTPNAQQASSSISGQQPVETTTPSTQRTSLHSNGSYSDDDADGRDTEASSPPTPTATRSSTRTRRRPQYLDDYLSGGELEE